MLSENVRCLDTGPEKDAAAAAYIASSRPPAQWQCRVVSSLQCRAAGNFCAVCSDQKSFGNVLSCLLNVMSSFIQ